jgi:hypothetical protein
MNNRLPQRWMGSSIEKYNIWRAWPPRSPYFTSGYFPLWRFMKNAVFVPQLPTKFLNRKNEAARRHELLGTSLQRGTARNWTSNWFLPCNLSISHQGLEGLISKLSQILSRSVYGRFHTKLNQNKKKQENFSIFKNFVHVSGTWADKFSWSLSLTGPFISDTYCLKFVIRDLVKFVVRATFSNKLTPEWLEVVS